MLQSTERALIPLCGKVDKDLRVEEGLSRDEVEVVTFWLGRRSDAQIGFAPDDLVKFRDEIDRFAKFNLSPQFEIPDMEVGGEITFPAISEVVLDLERVVRRIEGPLAFFIIVTPPVAEDPWVIGIPEGFKGFCQQQKLPLPFVYKIIFGGLDFKKEGPKDPNHRFSRNALRAHQLGGVYLPYDSDYPSVSTRRLVELMNRVMGFDLPGKEFPNYTEEELQKMAWHINREDFNLITPRVGAIPKYPIVKGRPRFEFNETYSPELPIPHQNLQDK